MTDEDKEIDTRVPFACLIPGGFLIPTKAEGWLVVPGFGHH